MVKPKGFCLFIKSAKSLGFRFKTKKEKPKPKDFSSPLKKQFDGFSQSELESLFGTLSQLIHKLNHKGILSVQRTCYGCKFYEKSQTGNYCNLLQKELMTEEIRLDCPEYEEKGVS